MTGSDAPSPQSPLESTRELLSRIRSGDDSARNELFKRYLPRLRQWAHGRLPAFARGSTDTDDLVQESMFSALRRVEQFQPLGEGAFLAYLRRILQNKINDRIRLVRRRPIDATLDDRMDDGRPSPLEQAIGKEALERYEAALARLPEDSQRAVVLRLEFGMSFEEVAEALGRPTANAARKVVERALVQLARMMNDERSR